MNLPPAIRVLLVEDNQEEALQVKTRLEGETSARFEIAQVSELTAARKLLDRVDIVLLDLNLEDSAGLATLQAVTKSHFDVPIIVLTGSNDEKMAIEALRLGAQDYVVKGEQEVKVLARTIRYAIERHASKINTGGSVAEKASDYDTVIGLPTRKLFMAWLKQSTLMYEQTGQNFGLFLISLDRFRTINDTLGHEVGDELLNVAKDRLLKLSAGQDLFSRLGGNYFGIIKTGISTKLEASEFAKDIISKLSQPYDILERDYFIGASLGVTLGDETGVNEDMLLQRAALAMQEAIDSGGNTYHFYSQDQHMAAARRLSLDNSLRKSIERNELMLYYQPCVDLKTGEVISVEALSRWKHDELGMMMPDEFIPLAEESGFILDLDAWALQQACHQISKFESEAPTPMSIAINFSALHFTRTELTRKVENILTQTGLAPHYLEIELTETALVKEPDNAASILARLKDIGVRISIDDFGVGYSSLNYLRLLPIDILKIDRSFISELDDSKSKAAAVVRSIIMLAKELGLTVVAEGVEDWAQLAWLQQHGCHRVQGFLFSQPVPNPDIRSMNAHFSHILSKTRAINTPPRQSH